MGEDERIRIRRRQVAVEDEVRRLERYVQRMERRYECPSEVAMEAVRWGRMKETADVALWLVNYQDLIRLRDHLERDRKDGIPGTTTGRSP